VAWSVDERVQKPADSGRGSGAAGQVLELAGAVWAGAKVVHTVTSLEMTFTNLPSGGSVEGADNATPDGPAYILHSDALDDSSVRLEFEAVLGARYRMEESNDLQTWISASEVVEVGLQRMQGIDNSGSHDDTAAKESFRAMAVGDD